MTTMLRLFLFFALIQNTFGLVFHARLAARSSARIHIARQLSTSGATDVGTKPAYQIGEGLPDEISKNKCIYDMILVERYSAPERTSAGLFLPAVEGKDQKHLGKVLSVPSQHGSESERGRVLPIAQIAPYKVGDTVFVKVGHLLLYYCAFLCTCLTAHCSPQCCLLYTCACLLTGSMGHRAAEHGGGL